MSASLVGSEMCIRDSPQAAWCPAASGCPEACGDRAALGRTLTRAVTSVSYTHLTLPTICSV
eukprot:8613862-Alexandrium_andersonii.AAC.1